MKIDDQLRRALGPRPAPEQFEDRVMARIAAGAGTDAPLRATRPPVRQSWRWTAAAAVVVALAGAAGYHQHEARIDAGARAASELRTALAIAGSKLAIAQQRVLDAGAREF